MLFGPIKVWTPPEEGEEVDRGGKKKAELKEKKIRR